MTINITASGNFENKKGWSGLQKHMEHDPKIKHKNKYLNTEESKQLRKYNSHEVLIDFDKWSNDKFGDFVKAHDENMPNKRRRFGSVKRFLEVDGNGHERKIKPVQAYIEKFANEDDWSEFRDGLVNKLTGVKYASGPKKGQKVTKKEAKDAVYRVMAAGLKKYARGFNKRNPNLKMFEYYVHMDEKGAPHIHAAIMAFYQDTTLTKNGRRKKPSWSLNRALGEQYNNKGKSRDNLKKFRKQEDEALIDSMNEILEKQFNLKKAFSLVRKTDVDKTLETGLDHDVYKARATAIKKQEIQKEANKREIAKQTNKINVQKATLAENQEKLDNLDKYDELVSTAKNKLVDVKKQQKEAENKREQAKKEADDIRKKAEQDARNANYVVIKQVIDRNKELDEREKALDIRVSAVIKKEKEQEEKAQELTKRENAIKKLEDKLKKIPRAVKRFFKSYFTEKNRQRGLNDSQASVYAEQYLQTNSHAGEQVKYDLRGHDRASINAFKTSLPKLGEVIPEVDNLAQSVSAYVKTQNKEETRAKAVGAVVREGVSPTDPKQEKDKEKEENPFEDNL